MSWLEVLTALAVLAGGPAGDGGEDRQREAIKPSRQAVPILTYHGVGPQAGGLPGLWVSRSDFARQLRWLDRHGYEAVRLDRVQRAWRGEARLPRRPVVLSFDDGYRDWSRVAAPLMDRHGWPGVAFLKAALGRLGERGARRLIRSDWEIGAHTIRHPDLRGLGERRLVGEIQGSRVLLERRLGVRVSNFAYPAGLYDLRVRSRVRRAGFAGAVSTEPGLAYRAEPYDLNRIRVPAGPAGLAAIRSGLWR